jgi:hypothetical protein
MKVSSSESLRDGRPAFTKLVVAIAAENLEMSRAIRGATWIPACAGMTAKRRAPYVDTLENRICSRGATTGVPLKVRV